MKNEIPQRLDLMGFINTVLNDPNYRDSYLSEICMLASLIQSSSDEQIKDAYEGSR